MKTLLFNIFCLVSFFKFSGEALAQASVCAGDTTTLGSATTGGTWSSSNTTVATVGLTTGIVTGVSAGMATITYSIMSGISPVSLTVNPIPVLSSPLTAPAICDSTVFNYTPESTTAGAIFTWSRTYIPGIAVPATSGTGNPDEALINTTYVPIPVVYTYISSANGCPDTQNVTVVVNPTPMLSSTLTPPAICDTFIYQPTSYTPGTIFTWERPTVTGISPGTDFGVDSIFEVLNNSTTSPIVVTYEIRLGISGCENTSYQSVTVTVDPCSFLSVNETVNLNNEMRIYPNPAHGFFTIDIPASAQKAVVSIYDIPGRVIETRNLEAGNATEEIFNVDRISPGIYFIEVESGQKTYREKLVVQ